MPSGESAFTHICESCGLTVLLTPALAYELGWDYPPRMGEFGVVSPRTCGACGIESTVWWQLVIEKKSLQELSDEHVLALHRIINEKGPLAP